MVVHSAPALVPITRPPVSEGAVAVHEGVVLAVGRRDDLVRDAGSEVRWPGVILPGLVNAHTHLQYTAMAEVGRRAYDSFEEWSTAFDDAYRAAPDPDWAAAALEGARAALEYGTTAVADVVTDPAAAGALAETGLRGVVYLEAMGETDPTWRSAGRDRFTALLDRTAASGISPHAPYTLDTGVLRELTELARTRGVRLHPHLAESAHEREYTVFGTGPLATMVAELGLDLRILREAGSGLGPAAFLDSLGMLGADCHVAHGIHLDAGERRLLRDRRVSIALCPRSNAVLGQGPAPVAALLRERGPVAVGTDSLASAPSLDLLEDVRLLREIAVAQGYRGADLDRRLLTAATRGGAQATGLAGSGYLGPGSRADFAVFDVPAGPEDVYRRVINKGRCVATIVGGRTLAKALMFPEATPPSTFGC
ncbi:amidohydrolase family protein [Rhizohabitans arisaemae]|uniref:amidohydrolase family protein n=1 Tax=Rhizohabitans arisaemae TaxID=2720610 RepID=UPI0024B10406|nr:amidohydrolase family protein [Rhizohabitans arisaemae]